MASITHICPAPRCTTGEFFSISAVHRLAVTAGHAKFKAVLLDVRMQLLRFVAWMRQAHQPVTGVPCESGVRRFSGIRLRLRMRASVRFDR
uniref:Uncharacterized protein n=1 Tax=mine drainage metagenome TaxID=410659 RepID=E6PLP3_9ZZZZ